MARFTKQQTLSAMMNTGMVPVFCHHHAETAKQVLKACYDGGVRVFEFTNRGDFAHELFGELNQWAAQACPDMVVGAGSVVDAGTASLYLQLGAGFIVSPLLNPDIFKVCNRRLVPHIAGCGTVSEIGAAHELGADMVKVFPAENVGGPSFVKNIKAPLPWTNIMVTGGVAPDAESLHRWFAAGVACVGIGSQLFPKEIMAAQQWDTIAERCRHALSIIATLK